MSRQTLRNLLKILVSAGLITYLFRSQVNLHELTATLATTRWPYVIAAALVMIFGTALRGLRWQVLLEALDIRVPLRTLVHLYFVGAFFNMFLPSGFGGDAVKMAKLGTQTGQAPESIGTTLVERATGLWVLFLMALIALPFSRHLLPAAWTLPILTLTLGGVVGGFVVMGTPLLPWLGGKIHLPGQDNLTRFYNSVANLGYPALLKACGISLIFDILLIIFTWLLAEGVDVHQPLGIYLLFTPIISFSLALPISVGGLGVREQTFVTLFAAVGVNAASATAMSLLNYVITYLVVGLIGGLFFMLEGVGRPTNRLPDQPTTRPPDSPTNRPTD
ncbi:MAG: lysylphosphatidylglycerol synthase transmembrane domain-containing protein [Anaerolineales bacterium]